MLRVDSLDQIEERKRPQEGEDQVLVEHMAAFGVVEVHIIAFWWREKGRYSVYDWEAGHERITSRG
jgi:hypothetical protein